MEGSVVRLRERNDRVIYGPGFHGRRKMGAFRARISIYAELNSMQTLRPEELSSALQYVSKYTNTERGVANTKQDGNDRCFRLILSYLD
jgi:hypothetical protein